MIDRVREQITNETMRLVAQDRIRFSDLLNCTIEVAEPLEVSIFCSTFKNTTITVLKKSRENWWGCGFDSCTFLGSYYDCCFGHKSPAPECNRQPYLRKCNFEKATLNMCSFYNCTADDLRLPRWPHITLFNPRDNASDFETVAADPILNTVHDSMGNTAPDKVAITYHLPAYMREVRASIVDRWRVQTIIAETTSKPKPPEPVFSLENLRQLLQSKPYVFM